jgi:hypothetical protein
MIYVTGDTHGNIDHFQYKCSKLTRGDYLIVCGDFGFVWDGSFGEVSNRIWLNSSPYTILFVDGNHENHEQLSRYNIDTWHGGKIHYISNNIIHLMRGQVFTIDGTTIFTFGGADSVDKANRIEHVSWWRDEMPNTSEYEAGLANLERYNNTVDYIITHCCSRRTFNSISQWAQLIPIYTVINDYFEVLESTVKFKHWYFGHYHEDGRVDDKHTVLYNDIININVGGDANESRSAGSGR